MYFHWILKLQSHHAESTIYFTLPRTFLWCGLVSGWCYGMGTFSHYLPFVAVIHWSPHKGLVIFMLTYTICWIKFRRPGNLSRHNAHAVSLKCHRVVSLSFLFKSLLFRSSYNDELCRLIYQTPFQWRHNELDDVPDHQPDDCLLNTSKLRVTPWISHKNGQ